jgi:transmembrane sensor
MNRGTGTARIAEMSLDERAAAWHLRARDPQFPAEARRELDAWLALAEENRTAYEATVRAWDVAGAEAGDADILLMREAALRFEAPSPHRSARLLATAAAVVAAAGLWLGLTQPWQQSVTRGQYHTAVGERATVRLADGSVVTLNTASQARFDLTGAVRKVRLLEGQAIFEVAQDKSRPFVVYAGDRRITALGTAFDVRIDKQAVKVTLVEGRVVVDQMAASGASRSPNDPPVRARLEPGEQLTAGPDGAASVRRAAVERVVSWRDGRLIFVADRLADALTEMNRYSAVPIVLADPGIGELRLSGVFRTGEPEAFAHALEEYFPLAAERRARATMLRWRR